MTEIDTQTALNVVFGTTSSGFIIALIMRTIWRRWSRDSVEVAKDRAENDIIMTYKDDNQRLREEINVMAKERNEALAKNGRLEAQVEIFKETIKKLEEDNQSVRMQLAEQLKIMNSLNRDRR